jgi:hypothetical protein
LHLVAPPWGDAETVKRPVVALLDPVRREKTNRVQISSTGGFGVWILTNTTSGPEIVIIGTSRKMTANKKNRGE